MKTREELQRITADVLHDLRKQANLSRAKMADKLNVDVRTYGRYESGETSPTLADFLYMLELTDAPALPTVMRHLYPELFTPNQSTQSMRQALIHFLNTEASDTDVAELFYILTAPHGSNVTAQLQLFTALDHLSIESRLIVAKLIVNFWDLESARGDTINADYIQPDMGILMQAIITATNAAIEGRNSYAAITKKGQENEMQKVF